MAWRKGVVARRKRSNRREGRWRKADVAFALFPPCPRGAAFQPEPTAAAGSRLHAPPLRARSQTAPDFHRAIIGHGPHRHQVDLRGNPPRKSYQACGSSRRILRSIPLVTYYSGIQFQGPTFPFPPARSPAKSRFLSATQSQIAPPYSSNNAAVVTPRVAPLSTSRFLIRTAV